MATQAHRLCRLRRRWRGACDRNPARRGHRAADGADPARSEHRDGALSWDRPKRALPERLRLSGAKPGGHVRPLGVVGRGVESGPAKRGRRKRHRGLMRWQLRFETESTLMANNPNELTI